MFRLIQEDSLSSILSSLFRINAYVGWRVYGVTDALEPICITVLAKPEEMWGISQEICCTYFRCALFCCGYVINHSGCIYPYGFMWCIYPYHLGLLHKHWGNHTGQSYDCPSACEAVLKDMGKINRNWTTTKQCMNSVRNSCDML